VISGPIGAGKSTVGRLLAQRFMSAGLVTAVADLDDVAFAQHGAPDLAEFWRRAGVAHTALVRGWFEAGCDAVIADGPFFESRSFETVFAACPSDGVVTHVLLKVAFEVARKRVTSDADRKPGALSTQPGFLKSTHESFLETESELPRVDLQLDTSDLTAESVADWVAERLPSHDVDA
jgi:shikimate kinase